MVRQSAWRAIVVNQCGFEPHHQIVRLHKCGRQILDWCGLPGSASRGSRWAATQSQCGQISVWLMLKLRHVVLWLVVTSGCYEWSPVVVMYSLTGTCGLVLCDRPQRGKHDNCPPSQNFCKYTMNNFTLLVKELGSKSSYSP